MGGKGGGGGDQQMYYYMMQQQQKEKAAKDAADLAAEQARLKDIADKAMVKPPEPEAPKVEAPAPVEEPKPVEALGPSVGGGGFIEQPGGLPKGPLGAGSVTDTGDTLGGSILNPPNYWTGGAKKTSSKSAGSQTNTET